MHLTLHLTGDCNMRCRYCYAPPKPGESMSESVAERALQMAVRDGAPSCGIVFFGGEPLLCKDRIAAVIARARALERETPTRFHFKVTTNGLLMDDDFLAFATTHHLMIALSYDGAASAHDRHRRTVQGEGTHAVVNERLDALLAAQPYAPVMTTVNPDTVDTLAGSIEDLIERRARYLIVSLNYDAPWTEDAMAKLERQYRRLADDYAQWTLAGRKFYLNLFDVKIASHVDRHCYQKGRCELGQRQLSVDPRGYLYPCVQFVHHGPDSEWCIGHVDTGIDSVARERIHAASQAIKKPCAECALEPRCRNTCGCLNMQTTGSLNLVSPVLCREEQMLARLADEVGNRLYKKRDPRFIQKHYNDAYPVLSLLEDVYENRPRAKGDSAS